VIPVASPSVLVSTQQERTTVIHAPIEAQLAGKLVPRIGYGTMRLTGPGVLGPPADRAEALLVLDRALQLGVRVFDTAWYYGPDVPNRLLAQALRGDPRSVVIATKLGAEYDRHGRLVAAHSPEKLREGLERDLRLLGAGSIAIVHLRWGNDRAVSEPFRRALAAMIEMRSEHSFGHIGLSNVGLAQLEYALSRTHVASVSNSFSVVDQADRDVVDFTARHGIAYLPWLPLRGGSTGQARAIGAWAQRLNATPAQVALAWLLEHAPNIFPIPGTAKVSHLEENVAAGELRLPGSALEELSAHAVSRSSSGRRTLRAISAPKIRRRTQSTPT
jgi:pyridoxine 4-dehydrogenase